MKILSKIVGMSKKEKLKTVLPLAFVFGYNSLVYWGAPLLASGRTAHDLTISLDESIPFIPAMLIVYFGCYIFWAVNYVLVAFQEDETRYRFFTAEFYAKTVCFLFFVFYPTTNVRPALVGNGVWMQLMRFLYRVDDPVNLFPSIHCLVSWFCCIGLRRSRGIPRWYCVFSHIVACAVFFSTLAVRQHVILDAVGGVVLAELAWFVSCHSPGWKAYQRLMDLVLRGLYKGRERLNHEKQEKDVV